VGKQMIADMRTAAEKVLAGQLEGKQVFNMQGGQNVELREANVDHAGLWYNPKNMHTAPGALGMLDVTMPNGGFLVWKAVFASGLTNYTVTIPDQSTSVVVTPTAYWPNYKSITVNGADVKSGASHTVALSSGANQIAIAVTGNDGSTDTYTLQIQR
jgi:hypothetical protein